ncbi:uncharacterized protein DNG_05402 [Cephalotrichum gorgonifer]|uniref:Phosphodiesterase n=1 Tax=Cephalotrichum gorgonifer TaxID=2041049 RepID=A0AAE8N0T9_9PEZI|nr:uncharacterized protein DNG_05402 [Cephalotrichum gorgonifer]
MDSSKYHIVYVNRRVREDRVVRAAPTSEGGVVDPQEIGSLGNDIEALLKYNDVHLCATGASCLAKLVELQEASATDLKPTVVLIDTPHDERIPASDPRSRSTSLQSKTSTEAEIYTPDDEVNGLELLQRVLTEAHLRNLSKLVVPIPVISFAPPPGDGAEGSSIPPVSSSEPCTVDPMLLQRCIDLGAADVIVSPINSKCMTSVGVQAYRAHKEAAREQEALNEVRRGRKLSWVGVNEEKPFAYLREAMVSGLMKGICRLGGDVDDSVGNFKIAVSTERQAAIAEAIGRWHFCAHDFTDDELLVAAMVMFKHALNMPALAKWRIPTDQLIDFLVACRVTYNSFVPYHNFRHVVDVLQATFHFLVSMGTLAPYPVALGSTDVLPAKSPIANLLGPFEGLTLLVTAIGHDVGHPGVNNGFLINLNAPLAQLYNDRSVLESFHCAAYSQILRRYWPSVFEDAKMRSLLISSILSTDMGLHFDYMKKLADAQARLREPNVVDGWDSRMIEEHKTLACSLLIKCADISNVARQHSTALQWMYILADEFSRQASMEGELGIPTSLVAPPKKDAISLSKAQLGFMKLFAIPLFKGVADVIPTMTYTVEELAINSDIFEAGLREEQVSTVSQCPGSSAGGCCDFPLDPEATQTPETAIMTTPAAATAMGDEGEVSISPLDGEGLPEPGYFAEPVANLAEPERPMSSPSGEYKDDNGLITTFDPVADFAASDPFNMRYRLDSYDHGKSGKQRCSETTDGSNSAPYSGDWTSQATSATTGKMPLSPSTQGTSIGSRESLDCQTSKTKSEIVVPEIQVPSGERADGTELETEVPRRSTLELQRQLTFTTSSFRKKRKVTRNSARDRDLVTPRSPLAGTILADTVLPSCEPVENDDDSDDEDEDDEDDNDRASFSFSAASNSSFPTVRPSSGLPARLQTQVSSLVSADYASSTASSPSTAYAELSIDTEPTSVTTTEAGAEPYSSSARTRSPARHPRRAIMSGDGDCNRSSSPLKRRASSMDPEPDETAADQPGPGFPRAMSVDSPDSGPGYGENPDAVPPLSEQLKIIQTLQRAFNETPVQDGDVAVVVSKSWVNKALALGGDPKFAKDAQPGDTLGPIDNSDIIQELIPAKPEPFVRLKPGIALEETCELFSVDAWDLVYKWYGLEDGQYPIWRQASNFQTDPDCPPSVVYELHPPVFTVHRLWSEVSGITLTDQQKASKPPLVLARRGVYAYNTFLKEIKDELGIPYDRKIRLWEVDRTIPESNDLQPSSNPVITPPTTPSGSEQNPQDSWHTLLLDLPTWSQVDRSRRTIVGGGGSDQTGNPKYNGKATLNVYSLVADKTLVVEESTEGGGWVSTTKAQSSRVNGRLAPNKLTTQSRSTSGRNSPASTTGPVTRGRAGKKKSWRGDGAVGLQNLGNTCYMNSALQCVRSVEELTKYFLSEEYVEEINQDNVLGFHGKMAMAYGNLLRDIYHSSYDSVRPSSFKSTTGQCRPTFASWGQQDSQEFLGFLLDALQEDLNRVKKKPYIEKPDSTDEMINDEAAIAKMADDVWEITKRRDDSVIADLFTGLYKSTLKCPVCHKISITFDPFNNLTLPLPVENLWSKAVRFYPLNDAPVDLEVDIPQHSSIEVMKQFIAERTGVPVERLIGAEEFKSKFFKIYDDSMDVSDEIQSNDVPTIHELECAPSNWPPRPVATERRPRKTDSENLESDDESWDDPRCDRMAVTVFHRHDARYSRGYKKDDTVPPHFIILTREEARSQDAIRRKILEKVASFSTWSILTEGEDTDTETADNTDADMALTSDADSGDSKVVAKSVEGEDDMVDVAMKDVPGKGAQTSNARTAPAILKQFNTRRPDWVDPDTFLDPRLQNLFEMSYFTDGRNSDGVMATGWSTVDETRQFPSLSSRLPEPDMSVDQDNPSTESWPNGNGSDNESGSDKASSNVPSQTRMMEESSGEEVVSYKNLNRMGGRGKQKYKVGGRGRPGKPGKTYSKKEQRRAMKAQRNRQMSEASQYDDVPPQPVVPSLSEEGALIHLGEGIVVDWSDEAWDTVFGKTTEEFGDRRGAKTFVDIEELKDPGLLARRKMRTSRRTAGITLDDCLEEFERAEVLSEQDMWYCPRCKEHRRASKKFDLWKTPDILVCHLKRFSSSHYRRDKIDIKVSFPVEGLNLESRVLRKEDGKDEIYDLIGVDEHYGGLGGGHYTATAKNFMDGEWYHYNDSSVSKVKDPSSVVSHAAYLLFYRRRSSMPLGGPRFEEICERFDGRLDDEADGPGSGDDQEVGGSSLYGSSTAGKTEPGAIRLRGGSRGLDSSNLANDGGLPSYTSVQASIEDEGIEMDESSNTAAASAYSTGWSFGQLDGPEETGEEDMGKTSLVDYASDDAHQDSASEGRDSFMDTDFPLPGGSGPYSSAAGTGDEPAPGEYSEPAGVAADGTTQITWSEGWRGSQNQDSDAVAEIRLEDESKEQ